MQLGAHGPTTLSSGLLLVPPWTTGTQETLRQTSLALTKVALPRALAAIPEILYGKHLSLCDCDLLHDTNLQIGIPIGSPTYAFPISAHGTVTDVNTRSSWSPDLSRELASSSDPHLPLENCKYAVR